MPRSSELLEDITLKSTAIDFVTIVLGLSISYFILVYATPNRRGFFCDDKTLSYPYRESTITSNQCFYGAMITSVLVVLVKESWTDEAARAARAARTVRAPGAPGTWGPWEVGRVRTWAVRGGRQALLFAFGMGVVVLIGNLGKMTVGRLRPHFFDVCPAARELCSDAQKLGTDLPVFIANFTCQGEGTETIKKVSQSFPSSHSAVSFYAAIFIVLYLESGTRWPLHAVVVKTVFEALVVAMAWYTALSRVMDYKHHESDVVAGIVFGTVFAWFWVRYVCLLQRQKGVHHKPHLHRSRHRRSVQTHADPIIKKEDAQES